MGNACHGVSVLSNLVLHRRRYHVDLPHGDCFEPELRHLQQAMAAEKREKAKKLYLANDMLRLSVDALFRYDRQLLIFQCGCHG